MATGVVGRQKYSGRESVWVDLDGPMVSVDIRYREGGAVLLTPDAARRLSVLLWETADKASAAAVETIDG